MLGLPYGSVHELGNRQRRERLVSVVEHTLRNYY